MVDLTNVSNLIGVLQVLSGGDDRQVKKVEKTLKPFLKNVNCILPLMEVLCGGSDDAVRQQAGLLLKKKIATFASRLTSQQQGLLKSQLVDRLLAETVMAVASTIAAIIATATISLQWPELASVLKQLIQDPNEKHRILTFTLVSELCDVGLYLPTKLISEVLVAGCEDSVDSVAEAALLGVTKYIPALGEKQDIMDFSPVIPPFLGVLHRCLANEEDNLVILGFQHLQMTFTFRQPLINNHIEGITNFILSHFLDPDQDYDPSVKEEAFNTLGNLIETLTKQFIKKKLVKSTLSMFMNRIADEKGCVLNNIQEKGSDHNNNVRVEEIDGYEQNETVRSCLELIDIMAIAIPAKSFADIAFRMSEEALSSSNVDMRKAGCIVLGTIVEGLREEARARIEVILPLLIKSLSDQGLHTREAASFALGQYAQHCHPEVYLYHHTIIPAMMKACNQGDGLFVLVHCCYALENLCEQLKPKIMKPYLSSLVDCVGRLASHNITTIQYIALSALASIAIAAEKEFQSYTDDMMIFLEPLLSLYEKPLVCSAALDCLGHIALAIGKDQFKPCYYELGMKTVMEFLKSDNQRLMESAFIHISNMSNLMKKEFEPSIKDVMPYILDALNEKELTDQNVNRKEEVMDVTNENEDQEQDQEEEEEEDDSDGEEGNQVNFNPNKKNNDSFINKKVSAITAIGLLARHTKSCFLPYLHQSILVFTSEDDGLLSSFNIDIRSKAISIFPDFIEVVADVANLPIPTKNERLILPKDVIDVARLVLEHSYRILDYDGQKKVVSKSILAIGSILKRLGASVLDIYYEGERYSNILTQKILTYLNEKGHCQTMNNFQNDEEGEQEQEQEEEEEQGDEDNHIYLLMENIGELIGILAKILSNDEFISSYFDQFHPKLLKFTKPSRSQADHDMAICCYVDVFEGIGSSSIKYADSILPVLKSALEDHDGLEAERRNAAYCLGVFIEAAGKELVPRYMQFLQWLHPVCIRDESEEANVGGGAVDNALGAVAKMILVAPEAIPLSQVLPVMFASLPMREDFGESTVVVKAFLHLLQNNDPVIIGMVKDLVSVLIENFNPDSEVPDATRDLAAEAIAILAANSTCRDSVYAHLSSMKGSEHIKKLQTGLSVYGMIWNGN